MLVAAIVECHPGGHSAPGHTSSRLRAVAALRQTTALSCVPDSRHRSHVTPPALSLPLRVEPESFVGGVVFAWEHARKSPFDVVGVTHRSYVILLLRWHNAMPQAADWDPGSVPSLLYTSVESQKRPPAGLPRRSGGHWLRHNLCTTTRSGAPVLNSGWLTLNSGSRGSFRRPLLAAQGHYCALSRRGICRSRRCSSTPSNQATSSADD